MQPYKRTKPANHDLAVLHELDISDKHHELLIAIVGVKDNALGWWGDTELTKFNPGPYDNDSEICRFTYADINSQNEFNPYMSFMIRLNQPEAGPWGKMIGATDLVRRSLDYIENEVIPRFSRVF